MDPSTGRRHDHPAIPKGEEAAVAFSRALARTLGASFRVGLYRREPPTMVGSWGPPRRVTVQDPVLALLAAGDHQVVNRAGGPGRRVTVLPLPGEDGPSGFTLAIEVDTAALLRASRLLSSLAEPDGLEETSDPGHLGEALDRLVEAAEQNVGVPVSEMSRTQKQRVVKYLDDRGAFLIKKAVEDVAARLGVSRFTVYNYLDQTNRGRDDDLAPSEGARSMIRHRHGEARS